MQCNRQASCQKPCGLVPEDYFNSSKLLLRYPGLISSKAIIYERNSLQLIRNRTSGLSFISETGVLFTDETCKILLDVKRRIWTLPSKSAL